MTAIIPPWSVVPWGWFPAWENWTWPGREGKATSVEVYSRYPSVRLYLNDKLVGEMPTTRKEGYEAIFKLPYQPGILKAVGVEGGKESETMQLETAGDPASIKLSADRSTIHADSQDLSFIQVDVLDQQGRLQPNADELVSFILTGPGTIAGLGNAWLKSTEPFQGTTCHVYHGRGADRPAWIEDDTDAPPRGRLARARLLQRGRQLPIIGIQQTRGASFSSLTLYEPILPLGFDLLGDLVICYCRRDAWADMASPRQIQLLNGFGWQSSLGGCDEAAGYRYQRWSTYKTYP